MFKELKKFKDIVKKIPELRKQSIQRDKEGRPVINVKLDDKASMLNEYCGDNHLVINSSLAEYIENHIKGLPEENHFNIVINNPAGNIDTEDFNKAVDNYYGDRLIEINNLYRKNKISVMFMFITGILALALALTLSGLKLINSIVFEILDIIAWVFLWETVDKFVFERGRLKLDAVIYTRIIRSEISLKK